MAHTKEEQLSTYSLTFTHTANSEERDRENVLSVEADTEQSANQQTNSVANVTAYRKFSVLLGNREKTGDGKQVRYDMMTANADINGCGATVLCVCVVFANEAR